MDGSGNVTVLHSFSGSGATATGMGPVASLLQGNDGNFYGTTSGGGANAFGTIFRMDGSGNVTVLHSFTGSGSSGTGGGTSAGLIQGSDSNFYGTARLGGANNLGTIFRMEGSGNVTVRHSFIGSGTSGVGWYPRASLIQGSDGNLYGTVQAGGANNYGTIFRVNLSLPSDGMAPQTTILTNPPALTNSTAATFTFSSTEVGTFECKLDGGAFALCGSPQTYNGLTDGNHSFQVRAKDLANNTDPTPATFSWTIDIVPPDTTITANPPATTNSTSATFEFTSTEVGSTFACNLDSAGFTTCVSPQAYNNLANGNHTFQVRAIDGAGNFDTTPASYTWTITTADITPPETTITGSPAAVTTATGASFTFTSSEPGSTFQCRLDAVPFAACTSPRNFTGLAVGSHTFEVRATDAVNNTDPSPASFTWVIDRTAPNTTITSGPPSPTNQTSATFTFESNDAGSTFQCRLDTPTWTPCTSPISYSVLAAGGHTFRVRAIDPAGNTDGSPAVFSWTIDLTAPNTTITNPRPTDPSNSPTATFTFTGSVANSTFACSLDTAPFAPCSSPVTYNGLADGSHSFQVQATDPAGNPDPTPAVFNWTVDTVAPDTTITGNPPALSNSGSASFTFSANDIGATFQCSLDGAAFTNCNSPRNYTGLVDGVHTFQVRARDLAGNVDPSPASYSWTVDRTDPIATITSGPPTPTNVTTATLAFTADDPAATFECRLDGAAFATCTSPINLSGLSNGNRNFRVRAIDAAGNVGPVALYTWTVDTTPPNTSITGNPGTVTTSTTATFTFAANQAGSTFECNVDNAGFTSCSSPATFNGFAIGGHNFQVRATDPAGNTDATPAIFNWTIQ